VGRKNGKIREGGKEDEYIRILGGKGTRKVGKGMER